jgi:TetR/AcrR family transcriptional regulator, transcriptional repressor of bet genes
VGGLQAAVAQAPDTPRARLRAFLQASFSPPNLDQDVLAVWVVFWGLYRHSRLIRRVQHETYRGYVQLLRDMLSALLPARARHSSGTRASAAIDLRLAAMGLTALVDGLWLEWCLDPHSFRPADAVALCEQWVESLCRRRTRSARA